VFGVGVATGLAVSQVIIVSLAAFLASGAILGLSYKIIKDIIGLTKRPSLEFAKEITVTKSSLKEHGGQYRFSKYLLKVKNEVENTLAIDCRVKLDLTSINISQYYVRWETNNEPVISIAHEEAFQLFTRSEFEKDGETKKTILFPVAAPKEIAGVSRPLDATLSNTKLIIFAQSSNANYPKPFVKTVGQIIDLAKNKT
jgi:hypothetical protein